MENTIAFERATTLERTTLAAREDRKRTVVILGGSYAAIQIAHRLLKYARMYVKNLKVVMVSKNSHLYWNLASVRAVIPGVTRDDDILGNIARGFAQYSTDSFSFVVGSAERIDPNSKTVWIDSMTRQSLDAIHDDDPQVERHEIQYDQIILATGTRAADPNMPWKCGNSTDETRELLHITQRKVEKAKHIVIGGAGSTGVELAGELGFEYAKTSDESKKKKIILVCKDPHVLAGDSIAKKAERELAKLGVEIIRNARIEGATMKEGTTDIRLSNGDTLTTDLYLCTVGLVPNSEYLPEQFKDERGYAVVDEYFQVVDAPSMWAVGDIVSKPRASFLITEKHAAGVAMNVENVLRGKDPVPVKGLPMDTFAVSVGRKRGVGRTGPVPLPSLAIYFAKGRNLGMSRMPGYLDGSPW